MLQSGEGRTKMEAEGLLQQLSGATLNRKDFNKLSR